MGILEDANKNKPALGQTVFEKPEYDVRLDIDQAGEALRHRAVTISGVMHKISRLTRHFEYQQSLAEKRRKSVMYLAYQKLKKNEEYVKANLDQKKILMESCEVDLEGEKTNILLEDERIVTFEYLASRGNDKLNEIKHNLDLVRTFLSWDKQTLDRGL